MSDAHLDHPGDWHWFSGYGPAEVVGSCPHSACPHNAQSVIAWGPDWQHYELVQCDVADGCAGSCRAWAAEYPQPYYSRYCDEWKQVAISVAGMDREFSGRAT